MGDGRRDLNRKRVTGKHHRTSTAPATGALNQGLHREVCRHPHASNRRRHDTGRRVAATDSRHASARRPTQSDGSAHGKTHIPSTDEHGDAGRRQTTTSKRGTPGACASRPERAGLGGCPEGSTNNTAASEHATTNQRSSKTEYRKNRRTNTKKTTVTTPTTRPPALVFQTRWMLSPSRARRSSNRE